MARIETYGRDNFITAFDKVIGTDKDSDKATKNYEMRDIRDYVVSGLPPNGGVLKVTHVVQDTPLVDIETPEDLLNSLVVPLDVVEFEIVIVSLTFNDSLDGGILKTRKFLLNRMLVTFGVGQIDQATANDFILIEKEDVDLIGAISNAMLSIGDAGLDVYKGYNNDKHEIRKIKSDSLDNSINGDSIKLEIPQSILDASMKTINSIGDTGVDVYKGLNVNSHEIRKIKSDTLLVSVDGDSIKIEAEEVDLGGVRNFYVNNQYTGTEELGTIAKPYKTIDLALSDYIGSGDIYDAEFINSRIIVQTSTSDYSFTQPLNIRQLNFEVEDGAFIKYTGVQDYMVDTRELMNHPSHVSTDSIYLDFHGAGTITGVEKGLVYAKGSGADGVTQFYSTIVRFNDDLTLTQDYDLNNYTELTRTVAGSDYYTVQGTRLRFYDGVPTDMPMIICEDDNSSNVNLSITNNLSIFCSTQIPILIRSKGYFWQDPAALFSVFKLGYEEGYYQHYNGVNPSANGTPTEIIPSTDFNFLKMEGDSILNVNQLSLSLGGGITGDLFLESAILLDTVVSEKTTISVKGGNLSSLNEVRDVFRIDNAGDYSLELDGLNSSSGGFEYVINYTPVTTTTKVTMRGCSFDMPITSNIDLTKGNTISVSNTINGQLVESLRSFADRTTAAAALPVGGLFVNTNSDDVDTSTHFFDIVI